MFHKIKNVTALPSHRLSVQFSEGVTRIYDVTRLFSEYPMFNIPETEFKKVFVDVGGYGIVWNDDLDLACDELWENGIVKETMQALEEYYEWQNNPQDYKSFDNFDELLLDIMN